MTTKKTKAVSAKKTPKASEKSKKTTKEQKGKPVKKELKKATGTVKTQLPTKTKPKPTKRPVKTPAPEGKNPAEAEKVKKPQADIELIKKQLIEKRREIIKEARNEIKKNVKVEARQIVEAALDDGDLSVIDLSQDIALKRLGAHRESLIKIDEALRKIQDGTYGVCDECGEQISVGRLKVMPSAIFCRDCQEKREELEKAGGEEEL